MSNPTAFDAPLPHAEVRSIIVGLMLALLLGALDQTIVAVSLPSISSELQGFDIIAWIVSGYLVAATVITPIYGKLADLYGVRRLLSFAIGLFLCASVGCALAQSMPQLVAARILQGLGGGGLIALAQTTIPQIVSLRERGRYQGYISGVYAVASVAGPVVGGLLTQYLSWRWVFWVNLPLGAAALVVSRRALARLPVPGRRRYIDYVGALLLSAGLAPLLLAITRIGQGISWHTASSLLLFAGSAALLVTYLWHERRAREPILPLELFKIRNVSLSAGLQFLIYFALIPLVALTPLRFETLTGVGADAAGLRLLPLTLAIPCGAFTAGRFMLATGRHKPLQLTGAIVLPLALIGLTPTGPSTVLWISAVMAIAGFAIGLQLPTALVAAQNSVPMEHIGIGTASIAFFRSLGGAIGIAVLSALLVTLLRHDIGSVAASLPGGDTVRDLIGQALREPDPQTRSMLTAAAENAFRSILYVSAAISALAVGLAALVREQPLRGRIVASKA
jgi:EmrB/QacA subfamily drug resistance transporter